MSKHDAGVARRRIHALRNRIADTALFDGPTRQLGNIVEAAALQVFSFIGSYKISSVSLITLIETNRNEGDKTHICHFPPSLSLPAIKFRKLNQSNLNNINTLHFSFNN